MRRTLIIGGLVVLAILILFGLYLNYGAPNGKGATNGRSDFFSALFPFGQIGNTPGAQNTNEPVRVPEKNVTERLRKVSDRPVAGSWFVSTVATTSPALIRFMERATGHIFETSVDSYTEVRISNTTIPNLQRILPISDTEFLMQSLSEDQEVQNFFGTLNPTASVQSVNTVPLPTFTRISASKGGAQALAVTEVASGSKVETMSPGGEKLVVIATSPIRSWVPFVAGGRFFIETAPSSGITGFLYEIKNKKLSKIVGGVPGLMVLPSPSGRYILYSGNSRGQISLTLLDTKNGETFSSPLGALATKCAWVSEDVPTVFCGVSNITGGENLPDDWLIGNISLNDSGWVLRPIEGVARSLGSLEDIAKTPIDVFAPTVSSDKKYVLFQNKNDLSLWALDITRDN